jgi:hypothetical protein
MVQTTGTSLVVVFHIKGKTCKKIPEPEELALA